MPEADWNPNMATAPGSVYDPFSLESSFASAQFISKYSTGPTTAIGVVGESKTGMPYKGQVTTGYQKTPQYAQVGSFFSQLAKDPKTLRQMQIRMQGAGLLTKGGYLPGVLDPTTSSNIQFVIQTAIASNISFDEAFARILKAGKSALSAAGPKGPVFHPPPFVKADPEAVDKLVDQAFQQATGRIPNAKERKKLTGVFRSWERKAYGQQLKAARAQFSGGKATVTDYSPEEETVSAAPEANPSEAAQYGLAQTMSAMAAGMK